MTHKVSEGFMIWRLIIRTIAAAVSALFLLCIVPVGIGFAAEDVRVSPADAGAGREEAQKTIVARVNGVGITREALISQMKTVSEKKRSGSEASKGRKEIREEALRNLIFEELAYQEAKAKGLKAEQEDIDGAMSSIKTNLGGDEGFGKFLKEKGITEGDLKAQVERRLTVRAAFSKEVLDKISVPIEDLKRKYEEEKENFVTPGKVSVFDVVFFLKLDEEASRKKVEEVLKKIEEDKDRDPRHLALDGTFIVREVELKREKEKELYEAAKKLKTGELSGLVVTPDSMHIIKLKEYIPDKQLTFDEVKISLNAQLRHKAQQEKTKAWEAELRKKAKIEIMPIKDDLQ